MLDKFIPIILSLLDTDLYKFTMLQTMLHRYPGVTAKYGFVCRNTPQKPLSRLKKEVEAQLDHLCQLHFTEAELAYLATKQYFKSDFIEFLRIFKLQRKFIKVMTAGDTLQIVAEGPVVHVMMFELFVLAIVNELHFKEYQTPELIEEGRARLAQKIAFIKENLQEDTTTPFDVMDFGTRRRFSREWHEEVVTTLSQELPGCFKGTSNVYLAMKLGLIAKGTMAHEYLQMFQGLPYQLKKFQKQALEDWVHEYRGDLGIALTDVISMDAFLADFDLYFAKLFDGLRHDSGNPVEWGEKAIAHYKKLRINPLTKTLVFSDGLDPKTALSLYDHFKGKIQMGFGIGTNLSNDLGIKALNIVMKMLECNGQPVAKLSDSPGKTLCEDETFLNYLKQVFNYQVKHPV